MKCVVFWRHAFGTLENLFVRWEFMALHVNVFIYLQQIGFFRVLAMCRPSLMEAPCKPEQAFLPALLWMGRPPEWGKWYRTHIRNFVLCCIACALGSYLHFSYESCIVLSVQEETVTELAVYKQNRLMSHSSGNAAIIFSPLLFIFRAFSCASQKESFQAKRIVLISENALTQAKTPLLSHAHQFSLIQRLPRRKSDMQDI